MSEYLEYSKLQTGCLLVVHYLAFIYVKERRRFHLNGKITIYDGLLGEGIVCLLLDGITAFTVNLNPGLDICKGYLSRDF